ncbi:UNVERIFIED_CONTAM: hypothetical protein O8I53_08040 [Campylobacter lari]
MQTTNNTHLADEVVNFTKLLTKYEYVKTVALNLTIDKFYKDETLSRDINQNDFKTTFLDTFNALDKINNKTDVASLILQGLFKTLATDGLNINKNSLTTNILDKLAPQLNNVDINNIFILVKSLSQHPNYENNKNVVNKIINNLFEKYKTDINLIKSVATKIYDNIPKLAEYLSKEEFETILVKFISNDKVKKLFNNFVNSTFSLTREDIYESKD